MARREADRGGAVSVRSRCVAMELNSYDRLDTYVARAPFQFIALIVSRAESLRRPGYEEWRRVRGLCDIAAAFWHAELPLDENITLTPIKGGEEPGIMWQMVEAIYGTRRASLLFLEFMIVRDTKPRSRAA